MRPQLGSLDAYNQLKDAERQLARAEASVAAHRASIVANALKDGMSLLRAERKLALADVEETKWFREVQRLRGVQPPCHSRCRYCEGALSRRIAFIFVGTCERCALISEGVIAPDPENPNGLAPVSPGSVYGATPPPGLDPLLTF